VVLLEVAETLVETQEAWLCPTAVVLLEDDAAMLQAEVEAVPQDDQKTYITANMNYLLQLTTTPQTAQILQCCVLPASSNTQTCPHAKWNPHV